jgi:hypothetical protein
MKYAILLTALVAGLFVGACAMYARNTAPLPIQMRAHDCPSAMKYGDEVDVDFWC